MSITKKAAEAAFLVIFPSTNFIGVKYWLSTGYVLISALLSDR